MAQYDGSVRINTKIDTKGASAQLMSLENRIVKTADKVASLRSKMDSLKNAKVPTQEYAEVQRQIEDTEKKINDLTARQEKFLATGGRESSSTYKRMQYDLEELKASLPYLQGELQDLIDAGRAFKLGGDTQEYSGLGQQLQYAENDLATLQQRQSELISRNAETEASYTGLGESVRNAFSLMKSGLKGIPMAALKAGIEGLKKAFSSLGNAVTKIAKGAFKALGNAAKSAFSKITGHSKKASKGVSSVGQSFKTMLKYGLGIRSMYVLFNKLRNAIKEGFGNLAQVSAPVNTAISSLKSSLTQLKNSLATAFAPILTAVAPMLTTLINMLSKAATYVGMFIAALTGQKTFTKAVAVQEDYAAGLEKTSSAAKDAAKAMKGYLSPLDEINKFESPDTSVNSGGGGSGVGGISPSEMFETVPIENSISGMVQKIKEMIMGEDWAGLGAYMASGINTGLQKVYEIINWENVGPKITYFINAFTTTINSLVDNINWGLLGQTIGAGLDSALRSINLLADGIDWVNLGTKFSEGLNGFVNEVDFTEVGKFFGNKFKVLNETIYGFVTNLNFENIGTALADGLNGLGSRIDLSMLATSLYTTINGLFDMIGTFIDTFDWAGLASNIYTGINTLLAGIDWANAAATLSELLVKLLDTIISLVAGIDWAQIGLAIWDFIFGIDWAGLVESILKLIWAVITTWAETIINFYSGVWDRIKGLFAPLAEWFGNLFSNAWKLIQNAWSGVTGFFSGIWKGITGVFSSVGKWFSGVFSSAVSGIKSAFSSVKNFFSGIWTGIKNIFGNVAGWFKDKFSAAWTAVKNVFSAGGRIFDGIKDGILSGLKAVVNAIIKGINKVIAIPFNGINSALQGIRNVEILGWEPFSWIPTISVPQIPLLATGAVIPPNKEFLAVLGDQKHGTNIEAPLETIKKANRESLLEVLSELGITGNQGVGNTQTIIIKQYLDGRQVAESVIKQGKMQQAVTGNNMFLLGRT